jgi:hypothetical protein
VLRPISRERRDGWRRREKERGKEGERGRERKVFSTTLHSFFFSVVPAWGGIRVEWAREKKLFL